MSDIYLNSTFPEAEIEKEKGVIIEEINMYKDMPNRHVQDLMMKLLYGDAPAGWNVAGEKKNILHMNYVPEATVLVVAGQVSEREVLKEVSKIFGNVKRTKKSRKIKVKELQKKPQVLVNFKKTDQTHFVLSVRTYDLLNKKNPALAVLGGVLGGGMSSRLFQKLREEMGVGYYVHAYNDAFTDHGFFQISAGVDNRRINEVIEAVLAECRKIKNEKIDKEELDKVKEFLIGNMKLSLESTDDIANFYGGQELLKRKIHKMEEKAKEIRATTISQIQNLAKDIFQNKKLNLALIGPFKEKAKFLKILKF